MPAGLLLLVLACAVTPPGQQSEIRNPHTRLEDLAAGRNLFHAHCAVCHGLDGSGPRGAGADLTKKQFRHGSSDAELRDTIREGIPGTEMPATFFQGKQLWQIVAHVRSLSTGPARSNHAADAARGKTLYSEGGCSQCHKINDDGGRVGPNLSDIGGRRSAEYLRTAVHWTSVTARCCGGSILAGAWPTRQSPIRCAASNTYLSLPDPRSSPLL